MPARSIKMDIVSTVRESLTLKELFQAHLVILILAGSLLPLSAQRHNDSLFLLLRWKRINVLWITGLVGIFFFARVWLALVDKYVPDPYLDEIFHIPQAQTYCEGRYGEWDDKITTPPGLYLISVAGHRILGILKCTPFSLRYGNLVATLTTAVLAWECRHLVELRASEAEGRPVSPVSSHYSFHTGINIALFPIIFFFSGLYYTDVVSTLVVLIAFRNHLRRVGPQSPDILNDIWTIVLGVVALFMRQTNVFWIVVYMGGLEAVHVLRLAQLATNKLTKLHDPPMTEANAEDWLMCLISIASAAVANVPRVLRQIWPHLTVLGLFAAFVTWNGGVVLGDKSNHVATIHLTQMLYIWPFFVFFSAPLFIPSILAFVIHPGRSILATARQVPSQKSALLNVVGTLATFVLSIVIIKFNTIIHPFTLADNRHYMFYVFRYTVRRSTLMRYSLVVVYTLSRWLALHNLAGVATPSASMKASRKETQQASQHTTESSSPLSLITRPAACAVSSIPPKTSTALLWLAATTLSLMTAPLVEPRYFILPWVFYRLLMPAWYVPDDTVKGNGTSQKHSPGSGCITGGFASVLNTLDIRLILETVWFVGINIVTMYVFLTKGFYWRAEDGTLLDGGKVQRFMW